MKKLFYILIVIIIGSCSRITINTIEYLDNKIDHSSYVYDNYQNHHWVGQFEGDTFDLTIDTIIEQRRFFGELDINNSSANFWVSKNQLGFWDESDSLKSRIKDSTKRKLYSSFEKLFGPNEDTFYINKRLGYVSQKGTHVNIVLTKEENEYFKPYLIKDLINKSEYHHFYVIESNGLEGWSVPIGYGNLYTLKNKSKIVSIANGKVIDIQSDKDNINGNCILIKHNDSIAVNYLNVGRVKVKYGDEIKKGEIIGKHFSNNNARNTGFGFIVYYNDISRSSNKIYK